MHVLAKNLARLSEFQSYHPSAAMQMYVYMASGLYFGLILASALICVVWPSEI